MRESAVSERPRSMSGPGSEPSFGCPQTPSSACQPPPESVRG